MEEIERLAKELKQLKEDQKNFKKENQDVFKENKEYNKQIGLTKKELTAAMQTAGESIVVVDGMEFEVKIRQSKKHSDEALREAFPDLPPEAVERYINNITSDTNDVATRKKRRTE
jgi:predicted  nucleic acid-binding Zn-ribbon protein